MHMLAIWPLLSDRKVPIYIYIYIYICHVLSYFVFLIVSYSHKPTLLSCIFHFKVSVQSSNISQLVWQYDLDIHFGPGSPANASIS